MTKRVHVGFSLVEILIVVSLFAVVGVVASQIMLVSLKNSRKSEASTKVRTSLEHSLSIIERQIRGAAAVTACSPTRLDYTDSIEAPTNFQCIEVAGIGYIASGSARLTNLTVDVDCQTVFSCSNLLVSPVAVNVTLAGKDTTNTGVEGASTTVQTKILLRN